MAAVLDTLQILIEADQSGLETQLKRAGSRIYSFVNQMNSQEVNWTSILSKTISPAIITGVASMFALAIEQSLVFQKQTKEMGVGVGMSSSGIKQFGNSVLNIASATGAGIGGTAAAFASLFNLFDRNQITTAETTKLLVELSQSGFGSLNSIVSTTVPLFQELGDTTFPKAEATLTALMNASQRSGVDIATISSGFENLIPILKYAGISTDKINTGIEEFGVDSGKLGLSQTNALFKVLADVISQNNLPLDNLVGGQKKFLDVIKNQGMNAAILLIAKSLKGTAIESLPALANAFQLTIPQVKSFEQYLKQYPDIGPEAKKVVSNQDTIAQAFKDSASNIRFFQIAIETMYADLIKIVGSKQFGEFFYVLGGFVNATVVKPAEDLYNLITGNSGVKGTHSQIMNKIKQQSAIPITVPRTSPINPNQSGVITPPAQNVYHTTVNVNSQPRSASGGFLGTMENIVENGLKDNFWSY